MKLTVRVKPGSRANSVEELPDGSYRVAVTALPEKGQANRALIELLAHHFKVPKFAVRILAGQSARTKVVEIVNVDKHPLSS
ncbi:DUF167 domain-containing protein [Candidatus Berkelbacteria bacterium]|nr:DUF167 domain-containing protein [Candidatus Berkelbacteria bacterium]